MKKKRNYKDNQKRRNIMISRQRAHVLGILPDRCVLTKGLGKDELFLFSMVDWKRFMDELHSSLPQDDPSYRTIRRHFIAPAQIVEVEPKKLCGKRLISKFPIPIELFDWLGGFEGDGEYDFHRVSSGPDSDVPRWEILRKGGRLTRAYDFTLEPERLYLEALLCGQRVVRADIDHKRLVLNDGTEIKVLFSRLFDKEYRYRITKMNVTDRTISDIQMTDVTDDEGVWRTCRIEADSATLLEIIGPDDREDSGFLFKVKYRNEKPLAERVRLETGKRARERYLSEE